MSGGHGHAHGAGAGAEPGQRRVLAIVLGITVGTFLTQLTGALISGSLALVADAGHLLTDVMGLALATAAATLASRPGSHRRTWGFRRAEVLSAALQAVVLTGVAGYVIVEGIRRLVHPPEVLTAPMLAFGVLGLIGNAAGIALLATHRASNLNMRAAFLEVLNDALGSVAVIVAAIVIATTDWLRADAIVSLLVGALILPRAVRILTEAGGVLLESTPKGLDLAEVREHLLRARHVHDVHDLHASSIATGLPVLTAHVVVDECCFIDGDLPRLLDDLQRCVADHFPVSVEHSTFQFEPVSHGAHEPSRHS